MSGKKSAETNYKYLIDKGGDKNVKDVVSIVLCSPVGVRSVLAIFTFTEQTNVEYSQQNCYLLNVDVLVHKYYI